MACVKVSWCCGRKCRNDGQLTVTWPRITRAHKSSPELTGTWPRIKSTSSPISFCSTISLLTLVTDVVTSIIKIVEEGRRSADALKRRKRWVLRTRAEWWTTEGVTRGRTTPSAGWASTCATPTPVLEATLSRWLTQKFSKIKLFYCLHFQSLI